MYDHVPLVVLFDLRIDGAFLFDHEGVLLFRFHQFIHWRRLAEPFRKRLVVLFVADEVVRIRNIHLFQKTLHISAIINRGAARLFGSH